MELSQEDKVNYIFNDIEENEENNEDIEDDEKNEIKVVLPKINKKRSELSIIFEQLIKQQELNMKLQSKNYKLQSEINQQESKQRYTSLDLSNALLDLDKLKKQNETLSSDMFRLKVEKYILQGIIGLSFFWYIISFFRN